MAVFRGMLAFWVFRVWGPQKSASFPGLANLQEAPGRLSVLPENPTRPLTSFASIRVPGIGIYPYPVSVYTGTRYPYNRPLRIVMVDPYGT
jgi:hypothetical protein